MKVYEIIEQGAWDYETVTTTLIFKNFEDALKEFKKRVTTAKQDMIQWCKKEDIKEEENINKKAKNAMFEIYKESYFEEFHDTILLQEQEIL